VLKKALLRVSKKKMIIKAIIRNRLLKINKQSPYTPEFGAKSFNIKLQEVDSKPQIVKKSSFFAPS